MKNWNDKLKKYNIISAIFRFYQAVFSPNHGMFSASFGNYRCRFHPSCSEYVTEAIRQYGLMSGVVAGLKRIIKCGPWHRGGWDPVTYRHNTIE